MQEYEKADLVCVIGTASFALHSISKVLVELFQKLAGFQRAAPIGRSPQRAKLPSVKSSAGVNPIKRSGGSFFGEGRPAIEGAPK